VVKSDLDLSNIFWSSLKSAAGKLEDVPEHRKDWHPFTNEQVLDLLHPSLFPLEYGKTRVLSHGTVPLEGCAKYAGKGDICEVPSVVKDKTHFYQNVSWGNKSDVGLQAWGSFQWLPSEIDFSANGRASITSYVNNLHPTKHQDLYHVLGTAIDKAVPLWNECLSWFHDRVRIQPERCGFEDFIIPEFIGGRQVLDENDPDYDPDYDSSDDYEARHNWIYDHIPDAGLKQPSAGDFIPFETKAQEVGAERIDLRTKFPDGLQVIFKLANIHLTPDKPHYDGSNWHVEGCLNEHIAATALFYYDSSNVTDSHLHCRQHVDAEDMVMKPEQNEYEAACRMYGIDRKAVPCKKSARS
jgi:hypothetical protein